ncbi:hypothetical protein H8356DRAFT_1360178 [Neocallimastix lanati (nom. inval.)]|nr:hypothetical protein H8356DRAFT_1360178 [Neocallimastix sp. JGI-2020a]
MGYGVAKKLHIEAPYAILKGKVESTIGGILAIPKELNTVILSGNAYAMGFLKC